MMNKEEIMQFLPHREPMLLVDQMNIDENNVAHGRYTVKGTEYFLQGHFPGYPVVPGVILCEIMGQCCSLLVKEQMAGAEHRSIPAWTRSDSKDKCAPAIPWKSAATSPDKKPWCFL